MILHWKSLKEECPLAIQIIEKSTGFKYDPAYQILLDENKRQITYANLEDFFDNQGWFLTLLPLEFPNWNGIISDSTGKLLLNDVVLFEGVRSRNHAKSLLAGIAIKFFQEQVKEMVAFPDGTTILTYKDIVSHAQGKSLPDIKLEDLTTDGLGMLAQSDFAVIKKDNNYLVFKNKSSFPFIGMIINK